MNIKKVLSAALLLPVAVMALILIPQPQPANAAFTGGASDGAGTARGTGQADCLFGSQGENCQGDPLFKTISNVLLFIIGAVSVIMLIFGGVRYVVSGGDSTAVQNAKNTILYAIVGIIVSLLAFAAVNFVISSLSAQN